MSSPASQPPELSQWDHGTGSAANRRPSQVNGQSVAKLQLRPPSLMQAEHEEDDYLDSPTHNLVAPHDFQPFFTLIEDSHTGEHYHPHVHYIFSDDDPDLLTTSIINASHPKKESRPTQRVVLVDLNQDGKTVDRVHSLSSDWQVSQIHVSQAPSWNEAASERIAQAMMLKIDGIEARKNDAEDDTDTEQHEDAVVQMESVIAGYGDKLARLQTLLDTYHADIPTEEQDVAPE